MDTETGSLLESGANLAKASSMLRRRVSRLLFDAEKLGRDATVGDDSWLVFANDGEGVGGLAGVVAEGAS